MGFAKQTANQLADAGSFEGIEHQVSEADLIDRALLQDACPSSCVGREMLNKPIGNHRLTFASCSEMVGYVSMRHAKRCCDPLSVIAPGPSVSRISRSAAMAS